MNIEVQPNTWEQLDSWWVFTGETLENAFGKQSGALSIHELSGDWYITDVWWDSYQDSSLYLPGRESFESLTDQEIEDVWNDIERWWDPYSKVGEETAIEIAHLLNNSNDQWARSKALFDQDPLSAELTTPGIRRGPLHPYVEEDWSQWLAQLLSSSEKLVSSSFDIDFTAPPENVIREAHLPKGDGKFRRADILVATENTGVSIEVKLGDEGFEKTAETARLVEEKYSNIHWSHILLLPNRQKDSLSETVEPELIEEDDQLRVQWENPGPIDVVFWKDVTAALRTLLMDGEIVDNLWAANAYMFCSVVEQRILRFQSKSAIDSIQSRGNIGRSTLSITMTDRLEEQLTYLREVVDS